VTGEIEQQELKDRINLIENMMAEGRRTTESWGWTFVLWGVAYYVAIGWSIWGNPAIAWPVTMIAAAVLTGVLSSFKASRQPETTTGRSMVAIWAGTGISLFLLMMSLGISGRLDPRVSIAVVAAMLGTANATSSIILKWKMQFACAVVWWAVVVAALFGKELQGQIAFLTGLFFCQIVFGIYGMICEARRNKARVARQGASHA
jgi:hypothetical protein